MVNDWDIAAVSYSRVIGDQGDYLRQSLTNPYILGNLPNNGRGQKILDLGCGEGYLSRLLKDSRVTGVDASSELLRIARDRNTPGELVLADITQPIAITDTDFDAVIINTTLQDVEDVAGALRNVKTHIRPGGTLIITIPHPAFRRPAANWAKTVIGKLLRRDPFVRIDSYPQPFATKIKLTNVDSPTAVYHRPLSWYVEQAQSGGFRLDNIKELALTEQDVKKFNQPLFLIKFPAVLAMRFTEYEKN